MGVIQSRLDGALAISKTNLVSITLSATCKVDRVTILKETSLLTIGKRNRFLTTPAEFHNGATLVLFRSRNSARSKHVSCAHIATSHRVVGNSLGHRVIKVLGVRGSNFVMLIHSRGLETNLEVNVVAAEIAILKVR